MYRSMKPFLTFISLVAIVGIGLSIGPAFAQGEPTEGSDVSQKKITLNLENADLRYALQLLFRSVGVS